MTAPTIPTSAAELEDLLSDPAQVDEIKNEGGLKDLITKYVRASMSKDEGIAEQIRTETQRVTAEFYNENHAKDIKKVNLHPDKQPERKYAASYSHKAPGAQADHLFTGWGDFLASTYHRARSNDALAKQAELQQIRNSFGSTVPSDGGFLIPEVLRSELLRVSLESAVVRPRARVVPMDSLTVPFPTLDSTSNVSSVYGGVTAYWTEEAGPLTESQATFGRVKLEAKKLTAYAEVPNELYSDSIVTLEAFINQSFPEAVAWFEDVAFLSGTGVGEPLGIFNADAAVSVAKETGQPAATIVWENIVKMYARMLPPSLGRAVWVCNQETFPELATMALNVGTGGSAIWLNNGQVGPPMTILGRPVIVTEKAAALGTVGDINFIDFGYYLIGDRMSMTAESSPHYKFGNDKTAIRFIERVDGRPWIQSAITPRKGNNTLSPFVQLATRS